MTSYNVIDKPQRKPHCHTGFKIHIDEGRMRSDELFVYSTYHLAKKKKKKKKKKKPKKKIFLKKKK